MRACRVAPAGGCQIDALRGARHGAQLRSQGRPNKSRALPKDRLFARAPRQKRVASCPPCRFGGPCGGVAAARFAPQGFVNTRWGTELPWLLRVAVRALQPLGRSPATCADFMCRPAFAATADLRARFRPAGGAGEGEGRGEPPGQVVLMGPDAQPARRTSAHTPAARDVVWAATAAVLKRAGLPSAAK